MLLTTSFPSPGSGSFLSLYVYFSFGLIPNRLGPVPLVVVVAHEIL